MTIQTSGAHLVGIEVLVLDADEGVHAGIEQLLSESEEQLHVTCVSTAEAALAKVDRQFFSVILVDIDTPTPRGGLGPIAAIKQRSPTSMVIAMTPRRSFDDAVAAVRAGAIDLILKAPESVVYLKDRVLDAAGRSVGKREVDHVLDEVRGVHEEFLQHFMLAERNALDLADRSAGRVSGRHPQIEELRVLVIDEVDDLVEAMNAESPPGFVFVHATNGGEGLDRMGSGTFHYAMVAEDVSDLPAMMVARTIRNQHPDTVVLLFRGPAENGRVALVEQHGTRPLVEPFGEAKQLVARLDDLAEAWRAKAKERRYTQAFREKHYDFLRRYVELKVKIERALNDGPG